MKKSTLITTIAMIVVVVVALSTATYAWFSSASQSTATGTISVTSASGWMIMGATRTTNNTTDTVAYDSTVTIDLNLLNGLYSPEAAITCAVANATTSQTISNLPTWYKALQTDVGEATYAVVDGPAPSVDPIEGGATSAANYIRVINANGQNAALTMTITVLIDAEATDATALACQELATYISAYHETDEKAYTANTKYDFGAVTYNSTTEKYEATHTASSSTGNVPATEDDPTHKAVGKVGTAFGSAKAGWTDASSGTGLDAKYTTSESNITSGYFYQRQVNFGVLNAGDSLNIAMFTWFNGWKIDSSMKSAAATVYIAFGTTGA